jgi:hypothetical protein
MPVVLATWETEAGGSLESRSLRPAWASVKHCFEKKIDICRLYSLLFFSLCYCVLCFKRWICWEWTYSGEWSQNFQRKGEYDRIGALRTFLLGLDFSLNTVSLLNSGLHCSSCDSVDSSYLQRPHSLPESRLISVWSSSGTCSLGWKSIA